MEREIEKELHDGDVVSITLPAITLKFNVKEYPWPFDNEEYLELSMKGNIDVEALKKQFIEILRAELRKYNNLDLSGREIVKTTGCLQIPEGVAVVRRRK